MIVIGLETTSDGLVVTDFVPARTPPLPHTVVLSAANGPHRWNTTEPVKDATPFTVTCAVSVTLLITPLAGICAPPGPIDGVVSVVETHSPILPLAKSNRVAVNDCEERVSPMKTLKQCPARFVLVRFSPPSKNSETRRPWPTPSVFSDVSHGVLIVAVFTMAHALSPPTPEPQAAPCATDVVPRDPTGSVPGLGMFQR